MFKYIDELLRSDIKITKKNTVKSIDLLMFIVITFTAIIARIALLSYISRDYTIFLSPWFDELEKAGGINGFGLSLGDYTPAYVYIMTLLTTLPFDNFISIKIVSIIFDFAGAIILMLIVHNVTKSTAKTLLAYTVFLFAPTICFNSALWAQCDIIFTVFLLLCIYYFIKERPFAATIFFGIAISFKLQAIFLAPLLIILWVRNRMKFRHFFLIPMVYLISILPAFILGRPLAELLTIYMKQAGQYENLSLNAPNLYLWVNGENSQMLSLFGITICFTALLLVIYHCVREKISIGKSEIISYAFLFSLLVPFLLPHMHERYFFVADALSILYAITYIPEKAKSSHLKSRIFIPIVVILSSLACYSPYLFGITPVDLRLAALAILFVICIVIKDIMSTAQRNEAVDA